MSDREAHRIAPGTVLAPPLPRRRPAWWQRRAATLSASCTRSMHPNSYGGPLNYNQVRFNQGECTGSQHQHPAAGRGRSRRSSQGGNSPARRRKRRCHHPRSDGPHKLRMCEGTHGVHVYQGARRHRPTPPASCHTSLAANLQRFASTSSCAKPYEAPCYSHTFCKSPGRSLSRGTCGSGI